MLNALGWRKDQHPGNFFYMMQSEVKAGQIFTHKIKPLFELSPKLRKLLTGRVNDMTKELITFEDGTIGLPAWSGSAGSAASFSGNSLFGDEVDKWSLTAGGEAFGIALLLKRMRDQDDGKLFASSTPAGVFIYEAANTAVLVYAYQLKCPSCNDYHRASEVGLIIPTEATAATIKSGEYVATQVCTVCGDEMDEQQLKQARKKWPVYSHQRGSYISP